MIQFLGSWLKKPWDLLWGNSLLIAEAFRLGLSHTSCLPCSPGVQAAATREDLSYDLKSTDDILKISEHFCCCLKKLSRHFPVWILHDKGPHPDWAISEGHTKAGGLDEATLTVRGGSWCAYKMKLLLGRARLLVIPVKPGIYIKRDRLTEA